MLELIAIPTLLTLGFAWDYFAGDDDDPDTSDDPIEITLADDVLNFEGTEAKEHVRANALDNVLNGSDNNDLIGGLDGADTLIGEGGDDRLFGGDGTDQALGGAGDDRIFLGDDDDVSLGMDGSDAGDDFIRGGAGHDVIIDTAGSNQVHGDIGHDLIMTIDGLTPDGGTLPDTPHTPDTVHAGYGNDTLVGDAGDMLTGGFGEDQFVVAVPSGSEDAPPAVLADFDLRDDLLSIVFLNDPPADPTVSFVHDADANVIRAMMEGREVATIAGLTPADIPFLRTFTTTLPDLLAEAA